MKSKIFTLLFAIVASVGALFAESGTCGANLTWNLTNGVLTISGTGAMTDFEYSSSSPWYSLRNSIQSVVIGNSVTSIGAYAFGYCTNLTSVTIPNSVTSIGNSAFSNCTSLPVIDNIRYADTYLVGAVDKTLTSYTIKQGTRWIANNAFSGCSSLTFMEIPNGIISIGDYAFNGCKELTSITIPDGVTSIGRDAFWTCIGLTSVTIPNSVTSIGERAFDNCTGLASVTIGNSITSIGFNAFPTFNVKYVHFMGSVEEWITKSWPSSAISDSYDLYMEGEKITNLVISNSITNIGNYAFYGCSSLTSVTIGDNVTNMGEHAFDNCTNLCSVTIGENISSIEKGTFQSCTNIKNVCWNAQNCADFSSSSIFPSEEISTFTFGNNVRYIPAYLCYNKKKIISIVFPENLQEIGTNAFWNCSGLTSIVLGKNVTDIGDGAFVGCSGLQAVTLGDSIEYIGASAFRGCTSLTSVKLPKEVLNIGERAFEGCSNLNSVSFYSNSLFPFFNLRIGKSAFKDCNNLTKVYVPDIVVWCSIYFMDADANPLTKANTLYVGNKMLKDLKISPQVSLIRQYAFQDCNTLSSISIPEHVSMIGENAFYNCNGVNSFYNYATTPQTINSNVLYNINRSVCTLYVPEQSINLYKSADVWNTFEHIEAAPPADFSHNYTIRLYVPTKCPDIVPKIQGQLMNQDVDSAGHIVYSLSLQAEDGANVSIECASEVGSGYLQSLEIYEDTTLWENVKIYMPITMEDTVITYDFSDNNKYRFSLCDGIIRHVQIGDLYYNIDTNTGVAEVSYEKLNSSSNYSSLTTVEIPSIIVYEDVEYLVTRIGDRAFQSSNNVTSLTIPSSVVSIGASAMSSIYKCATIVVPSSVKEIGYSAFWGCANVEYHGEAINDWSMYVDNKWWGARCLNGVIEGDLVFADSTKTMLCSCFARATDTIVIPAGVKYIGRSAFQECRNIISLRIPESVDSIGEYAFLYCTNLKSIYNYAKIPQVISQYDVSSIRKYSCLLYVLRESVELYKNAVGWQDFENIRAIGNYCGDNLQWETRGDTLVITGYGDMYNYTSASPAPWGNSIKFVILPDGLSSLGHYAFYNCKDLNTIEIPQTVTLIGSCVFYNCTNLTSIICNATTPPACWTGAFNNFNKKGCTVYVPTGCSDTYKSTSEWKNFPNIYVRHTYTVRVYAPDACEGQQPAIIGDFNEWKLPGVVMTQITDADSRICYTYTFNDVEGHAYKIKEAEGGSNSLMQINIGKYRWQTLEDEILSAEENIVIDRSDNTKYRFGTCKPEKYYTTIRIRVPEGEPASGVSMLIDDKESAGRRIVRMSLGADSMWTARVEVTEEYMFQICEYSNSHNCIMHYSSGEETWRELSEMCFGDFWKDSIGEKYLELDYSNASEYKWKRKRYNCGDDLTWQVVDGELIISGTGSMWDYSYDEPAPWGTEITSVSLPEGLTTLGNYAFFECVNLSVVDIPKNVSRLYPFTFLGCGNLQAINVSPGNTNFCSLYGVLYNKSKTALYIVPNGKKGKFTIPKSVTTIYDYAFMLNNSITDITIPSSVNNIGNYAFAYCNSMERLICNAVTPPSLGEYVFVSEGGTTANCTLYVPEGSINMYKAASQWRDFVYILPIPDVVDTITVAQAIEIGNTLDYGESTENRYVVKGYVLSADPYDEFNNSQSWYMADTLCAKQPLHAWSCGIDTKVEDLDCMYVQGCLTNSWGTVGIQFGGAIHAASESEFVQCYDLSTQSADIEKGYVIGDGTYVANSIVKIEAVANDGSHFVQWSDGATDNPRLIMITQDSLLIAYFNKDTKGRCGDDLMLTWEYDTITNTLTISGNGALNSNYDYSEICESVNRLIIADGVTSIGPGAFSMYDMTLNYVSLAASVKTIQEKAFYNCQGLHDIYSYREKPSVVYSNTFDGVDKFECTLHVLAASVDMYKVATGWRDFYYVKSIDADEISESIIDVITEPRDNEVIVTWPISDEAETYTLTITKDEVVFCTLFFNANGQLRGIAFAPDRDGKSQTSAASLTESGGLRFTVTGLQSATSYHLLVQAKDAEEKVLVSYSADFQTTGYADVTTFIDNSDDKEISPTKVVRNGQIYILRGDRVYTVTGQKVK